MTNKGEEILPDVRLVDGVPAALHVRDGSPHVGTVLRVGESRTYAYTIRAERGIHIFDSVVACRSVNGSVETTSVKQVETTLSCRLPMNGSVEPPLRDPRSPSDGRLATESGGRGTEFHSVREYRPEDRISQLDWARYARLGELATLEFREKRTASVVLCSDARPLSFVGAASDTGDADAVESSVRAAASVFTGVLDAGDQAGVAAVGSEFVWLGPGTGRAHRRRAQWLLTAHPTLSRSTPRKRLHTRRLAASSPCLGQETAAQLRRLARRLPADAQVFVLSPMADNAAVALVRRLRAAGNPVTVVSPDATTGETVGARLARVRRHQRRRALYGADVRVVDWNPDDSLSVALEQARETWR